MAFGVFAVHFLKLSKYWYVASLVPLLLVNYMDHKYVPYGELENFYKYAYERRKASSLYKTDNSDIEKELEFIDKEAYNKIKEELKNSNKTLYEVASDFNEIYLQAAVNSPQ